MRAAGRDRQGRDHGGDSLSRIHSPHTRTGGRHQRVKVSGLEHIGTANLMNRTHDLTYFKKTNNDKPVKASWLVNEMKKLVRKRRPGRMGPDTTVEVKASPAFPEGEECTIGFRPVWTRVYKTKLRVRPITR
jgi:hypothetical protein